MMDAHQNAEALARKDVEEIKRRIAVEHENHHPDDVVLIVDGTQFSPSWRALPGGAEVWAQEERLGCMNACEVYDETLSEGLDEMDAYWDDGCIWIGER